jgi:lipopolysaccharide export system ATP-binding protein
VSLLEAENVRKGYGGRVVVKGVSLSVQQGRITGLLGPNGAGKTTTFYMVVGAVRPDSGRIHLDGVDVSRMPMHLRARMGIGYLAQEASIFRDLSVWDNVMAILEFMGLSRRERDMRAAELLEELSLMHVKDSLGRSLSGGERRRAEIARTLAGRPSFILLDEPFAGVDPIAVGEIQRIVRYLKEKGLGILITDHNVRETLSICDHTYVMNAGEILVEGGADEIISNPQARKIYLGEDFDMVGVPRTAAAAPSPPPAPADPGPAAARFPAPEEFRLAEPLPAEPPSPRHFDPVEFVRIREEPEREVPVRVVEPLPARTVWPPPPGEPMVRPGGDPPGGPRIFGEGAPVRRAQGAEAGPRGIPWPLPPGKGKADGGSG